MRIFLVLIALLGCLFNKSHAQSPWYAEIGSQVYQSFSQTNNDFPMRMGYPVFKSTLPQVAGGLTWQSPKFDHHLRGEVALSTRLAADDGLGANSILQAGNSNVTAIWLQHQFFYMLLKADPLYLDVGGSAGLDAQFRRLDYKSGVEEKTRDVNLAMGPDTRLRLHVSNRVALQAEFASLFYLPYLNIGKLKKRDIDGSTIESVTYHAFYYRTRLDVSICYQLRSSRSLCFGYRNDATVGFANTEPAFYIDTMVHYRMDCNHHLYLQFWF